MGSCLMSRGMRYALLTKPAVSNASNAASDQMMAASIQPHGSYVEHFNDKTIDSYPQM
jgi:hypothetical protein